MEVKKRTLLSALTGVAGVLAEFIFHDIFSNSGVGVALSIILAVFILVAVYFVLDGFCSMLMPGREEDKTGQGEYEQKIYGVLNELLQFEKVIYREVRTLQQTAEDTKASMAALAENQAGEVIAEKLESSIKESTAEITERLRALIKMDTEEAAENLVAEIRADAAEAAEKLAASVKTDTAETVDKLAAAVKEDTAENLAASIRADAEETAEKLESLIKADMAGVAERLETSIHDSTERAVNRFGALVNDDLSEMEGRLGELFRDHVNRVKEKAELPGIPVDGSLSDTIGELGDRMDDRIKETAEKSGASINKTTAMSAKLIARYISRSTGELRELLEQQHTEISRLIQEISDGESRKK